MKPTASLHTTEISNFISGITLTQQEAAVPYQKTLMKREKSYLVSFRIRHFLQLWQFRENDLWNNRSPRFASIVTKPHHTYEKLNAWTVQILSG